MKLNPPADGQEQRETVGSRVTYLKTLLTIQATITRSAPSGTTCSEHMGEIHLQYYRLTDLKVRLHLWL